MVKGAVAECPGCHKDHALNSDGRMRMHSPDGYRGSAYNPNVCIGVGVPPGTILCGVCNGREGNHYGWCSARLGDGRVGDTNLPSQPHPVPFEQQEAAMSVSAKFYVRELTQLSYAPGQRTVKMSPVTRGEENRDWAAATPSGEIVMSINNEAAAQQFELGVEYLITFTRVVPLDD